MSINKIDVMYPLEPHKLPFQLVDGEAIFYKSPTARQLFTVKSKEAKGPVKVNISVPNGYVFVTSNRFIYITESQGDLESFSFNFVKSSPCQFSHTLKTPWFGPNYWSFMFFSPQDASCDGFPKSEWFEGHISFKDGGLFDFSSSIERAINDAVNNVHIDDELPRYSTL